jgi:hypothetical protein
MLNNYQSTTYAFIVTVLLCIFLNFLYYKTTNSTHTKHEIYLKDQLYADGYDPNKTSSNYKEISLYRQNSYNYIKKYPFLRDCKNDYNKLVQVNNSDSNDNYKYNVKANQDTHKLKILKAILVYFPLSGLDNFEHELRWLYRSWIEMLKHEPEKWRTDIVVFVDKDKKFDDKSFFFNELDCLFTNRRKSASDPPMCILIEYKALKDRDFSYLPGNSFDQDTEKVFQYLINDVNIFKTDPNDIKIFYSLLRHSLSNYGYLDSILTAFDGYEYLKSAGYDILIRSDMDVFLTPLLG